MKISAMETAASASPQGKPLSITRKLLKRGWPIYLMILPGFLFFIIFRYAPMIGLVVAFKDFNPFQGLWASEWVGLAYFERLFTEWQFLSLLKNTLILNFLDVVFFFPAPIVLAILLNEIRIRWFRVSVQTILYMPHFLSWVVIVGITLILFSSETGGFNIWLSNMGLDRIELLTDASYFRPLWLTHNIWQGTGWSAIIFLASIAAIDPGLYEAAKIDGASRLRQIWHVTLPGLRHVIIIVFILRLGNFIDLGFEHIYLLQSPLNMGVSDVFDTYIYRTGILNGQFGYTAAIGLFKSIVGLILVVGANKLANRMGQEGVY